MRCFLAWLACAVGAAWLYRRLRGDEPRSQADPAEELRRTLAESRMPEPAPETDPKPEAEGALDERRRAVHDRGRAAIDEMRGGGRDE